MDRSKNAHIPDGGYGWIIVFSSFMCVNLAIGTLFSFGTMVIYFVKYYEVPKSEIAWIGSLANGFILIFGKVYGAFLNEFGCRINAIFGTLVTVISLIWSAYSQSIYIFKITFCLTGIGVGIIFLSATSSVVHYFSTKRGLAVGIVMSGSSIGILIMAPFLNFLLQTYDFSGAMLILAGILLHCIVFGALMRPLDTQNVEKNKIELTVALQSETNCHIDLASSENSNICDKKGLRIPENGKKVKLYGKTKSSNISNWFCCKINEVSTLLFRVLSAVKEGLNMKLLKDILYLLPCLGGLFGGAAALVPLMFLPHCAILKGVHSDKAVLLISAFGIANLFGKLILGFLANKIKINVINQYCILVYIYSIILSIIPMIFNYELYLAISALLGFFNASVSTHIPLIFVEVAGLEEFNKAIGMYHSFFGVSSVLSPPFAGFLFDVTGSYDASFFMAAGFFVIHGTFFLILSYFRNKGRNSKRKDDKIEAYSSTNI